MSIADYIEKGPPLRGKRVQCAVGDIYDELVKEGKTKDAEGLKALVEQIRHERLTKPKNTNKGWTASALSRVLVNEGHKVGELTVQRHVTRYCACGW